MNDLRAYKRIDTNFPCSVFLEVDGESYELSATISSVSETGICFDNLPDLAYERGQMVTYQGIDTVKISKESTTEVVYGSAQIVRIIEKDAIALGCQIISLDTAWKNYVKKKELEDWLKKQR